MALDFNYRGSHGECHPVDVIISTALTGMEQTIVCAAVSVFGLPNSPGTASFLTSEERTVASEWLLSDNPCAPPG